LLDCQRARARGWVFARCDLIDQGFDIDLDASG